MNINRIGEAALTQAQKRKVRRLARAESLTAEQIASVLDLSTDLVEAELVEYELKRSIDPEAAWRKERDAQKFIPDAKWADLFAANDRDSIIRACIPIIDKHNRSTPKSIRADVAQYALLSATKAVDKLLGMSHPNPTAYLCTEIKGAISKARFSVTKDARDCVSTPVRKTRPKKRATDAERDRLVAKWRNEGMSAAMIDAELDSLGLKSGPAIRSVESQWPEWKGKGGVKPADFAGNVGSARRHSGKQGMIPLESSSDASDWTYLAELVEAGVLTQEQLDWLKLKSEGWTHVEIFEEFGVAQSEQTQILKDIQDAIRDYTERNLGNV